ncbi:MAG: CpsD/CapB family tyrosine-protein kinase [Candidatus Omnitrophota bacterium]|nr:CpsD/CapB family tyrosine-protein kinase [Candidatus Omnitrophota bacterium]
MGRITDALKKVADERVARIQKKPEIQYVVKQVENTKIKPNIVAFHDSASPVGEQYKIIRSNIQSLRAKGDYKTFVITSSVNGEGKTVTSINLAMTMAHDLNDKSVLLIDADMRKGKVAKYMGLNSSPGLAEILRGEIDPNETFVSPNIKNLTIIPQGKVPKNPAELISSKKMTSLLASLKARFDYIFIDSPPVMPLADPCLLGSVADGTILVIKAGKTQREMIKTVEHRLAQARVKLLGYIMTSVECHLPHYLYRYVNEYSGYSAYYEKENVEQKENSEELVVSAKE